VTLRLVVEGKREQRSLPWPRVKQPVISLTSSVVVIFGWYFMPGATSRVEALVR